MSLLIYEQIKTTRHILKKKSLRGTHRNFNVSADSATYNLKTAIIVLQLGKTQ